MLELLKLILSIVETDISKDAILQFYLQQAEISVHEYCNVDELPEKYNNTIVALAGYLYRNQDVLGYTQKSEGERSVSFQNSEIPDYITGALPKPKIRIGGV